MNYFVKLFIENVMKVHSVFFFLLEIVGFLCTFNVDRIQCVVLLRIDLYSVWLQMDRQKRKTYMNTYRRAKPITRRENVHILQFHMFRSDNSTLAR